MKGKKLDSNNFSMWCYHIQHFDNNMKIQSPSLIFTWYVYIRKTI